MRIFTATNNSQGMRPKDLCLANEGEWVFQFPDDALGIVTSGLVTQRPTTTFRVVDLPVSPTEYLRELAIRCPGTKVTKLEQLVDRWLQLAEQFKPHQVLEVNEDGVIVVRRHLKYCKFTV